MLKNSEKSNSYLFLHRLDILLPLLNATRSTLQADHKVITKKFQGFSRMRLRRLTVALYVHRFIYRHSYTRQS